MIYKSKKNVSCRELFWNILSRDIFIQMHSLGPDVYERYQALDSSVLLPVRSLKAIIITIIIQMVENMAYCN
jgi:hypothetical protein